MHTKKATFNSFFDSFKYYNISELMKVFGSRLADKTANVDLLKEISESADKFLEHTNSCVLITDMKVLKTVYVSPSIQQVTGYSPQEFIDAGTTGFMRNFCPADKAFGFLMLHKISSHQKQQELLDKHLYQYITNFRYLNKEGYYTWMYNRMMFVAHDARGNPSILFSLLTGMEPFKTDDSIHFSRLKYDPESCTYQIEIQEAYSPEYLSLLGKTEMDILKLLANGMDNAEIAYRLKLSEHTIKDYRKRMLQKTWCDNTAELLSFALRNKII